MKLLEDHGEHEILSTRWCAMQCYAMLCHADGWLTRSSQHPDRKSAQALSGTMINSMSIVPKLIALVRIQTSLLVLEPWRCDMHANPSLNWGCQLSTFEVAYTTPEEQGRSSRGMSLDAVVGFGIIHNSTDKGVEDRAKLAQGYAYSKVYLVRREVDRDKLHSRPFKISTMCRKRIGDYQKEISGILILRSQQLGRGSTRLE